MLKLDDIGVIEIIQENPYIQYFLGLKGFTQKPVFDPSLLVYIRKRIDLNVFESLTDELIHKGLKIKSTSAKEAKEGENDDDESTPTVGTKNKGKLQLEATVADAQIKFPTDLDLLNDSRVKAEDLIDHLCQEFNIKDKQRTYRKIARKEYLNVSKMKRKPDKVLRRGLKLQINYLKRDINIINGLLDKRKTGRAPFDKHQNKYFFVIQHVLDQQESMFKNESNSCEDRIVNIRHTGDPLGRIPVKTVKSYYMRRKERREAAERNQIEGKLGQGKNGYNLNQIRAKLSSTSKSWIAAIIFVMNVIRYCRDFPGSLLKWLFTNVMKMREDIILTFMPAQRNF